MALLDGLHEYRPVTYREWNRAANRTAHWLASLGVGHGDLVAVLSMNCVEYLDVWFACGKLGAIMQTLNWRLAAGELCSLLADVTPKVLLYGPDFTGQVQIIDGEVRASRSMPPSIATLSLLRETVSERTGCLLGCRLRLPLS